MKISSKHVLNLGSNTELYFKLLSEEDYDFKTKKIEFDIQKNDDSIIVNILAGSILDLKIADSAFIRSLEVIDKTLNV